MPLANRLVAEILGTCWLVFGGCGSAVLAAKFVATEGSTPLNLGIAFVGVSLAFGLNVLSMAFAIGVPSGALIWRFPASRFSALPRTMSGQRR